MKKKNWTLNLSRYYFIFVTTCGFGGLLVGIGMTFVFHSNASSFTPPSISISEIMSCPTTGNKEWVELQRNQDSATQLPNSSAFSLADYQLEDDKAIIWTGTETVPEPGPITGVSGDPLSTSIGGYFAANDPFTTITFNKHYLNNTGDILKLWSPTGELLEQVTIPACSENGKSWTFQDGDWQPAEPTPGQENPVPSPSPSPSPTPISSPSPSSNPTTSSSPSPQANAHPPSSSSVNSSPDTTTSTQQQNSAVESTNATETQSTISFPQPASYLAKINQTSQRNQVADLNSDNPEKSQSQVLGLTDNTSPDQTSTASAKTVTTASTPQPTKPDPYNHNLLYSPDRSIFGYLSAILGGALVTAAAGLLAHRASQAQTRINTNNTPPSIALSL